jgi:serine protease Do
MTSGAILGMAHQLAGDASALAELLQRAVVEVRSGQTGSGAGVIWGGSGLVVTNAHCAPRGVSLSVASGGRWVDARAIAYHPRHDLALLAAAVSGPALELRDPASLRAGELAFAHGHPLGVRDALAMGVIHGVARRGGADELHWVLADVRLAPGNSGGPLVDAEGRLIGINSMVVNGLGVAIPATLVRQFVERALIRRAA